MESLKLIFWIIPIAIIFIVGVFVGATLVIVFIKSAVKKDNDFKGI